MFNKKTLSILGDSISTYQGISNDGSANESIIGNPYFYRRSFPLEKLYWKRIMGTFDLELCVNNSWSGGNLSGIADPNSGVNRVRHLSNAQGQSPDLIILFMGMNDLGRRIDVEVFAADYQNTLQTIKEIYPKADVCCVNLPSRDETVTARTECFNQAIQNAVDAVDAVDAMDSCQKRFFIADLFHSQLKNDDYYMNTVDGLHPDEDGMRIIAQVIENVIREVYHC